MYEAGGGRGGRAAPTRPRDRVHRHARFATTRRAWQNGLAAEEPAPYDFGGYDPGSYDSGRFDLGDCGPGGAGGCHDGSAGNARAGDTGEGWAGGAAGAEAADGLRGALGRERVRRAASTPGSPLGAAVGALAAAIDALAAAPPEGEHVEVLADALVAVEHLAARLDAAGLGLLADFARRDGHRADGTVSAAAWLAARTGTDHTAAHHRVHTARRLSDLPRIADHLAAGDITPAHATAITRAATVHRAAAVTAAQDLLADLACTNPPSHLRHALRRLAEVTDPDGAAPGPDGPGGDALRDLRLRPGYAGRGELIATLDPLTREALTVLLDAFDAPDPKDTSDHQRRTPTQRRHDAFAAMLHTLLAQPGLPTVQGARPTILITFDLAAIFGLPPHHPLADLTLADLASHLGIPLTDVGITPPDHTGGDADADTSEADRDHPEARDAQVGDAEAPDGDHPDPADEDGTGAHTTPATGDPPPGLAPAPPPPAPPRPPRFGSGVPASPALIRGLLPAATIMAVLTLGRWRAVNVGDKHRTLPAWLRTVLAAMHQHCRGPDCDHPATWTHAHHITPWAKARTTDLNDTLPLCPAHHKLLDVGWATTLDHTTGDVTWTSPTGRTITVPPPNPHPWR